MKEVNTVKVQRITGKACFLEGMGWVIVKIHTDRNIQRAFP